MSNEPPEGFEPFESSPFLDRIGGLYISRAGPTPIFGIRVEPHHGNTLGIAHGGFLMTLVDLASGQGTRMLLGHDRAGRTASTTVDFLGSAAIGDWIEANVAIDRAGSRLVFTSCRLLVGDRTIARAQVVLVSP